MLPVGNRNHTYTFLYSAISAAVGMARVGLRAEHPLGIYPEPPPPTVLPNKQLNTWFQGLLGIIVGPIAGDANNGSFDFPAEDGSNKQDLKDRIQEAQNSLLKESAVCRTICIEFSSKSDSVSALSSSQRRNESIPVIITSMPRMEAMVTRLASSVSRRIFFASRSRCDSYLSIESTLDGAESRVEETGSDGFPLLLVLHTHGNIPRAQEGSSLPHVIFLDKGNENCNILLVHVAFRSRLREEDLPVASSQLCLRRWRRRALSSGRPRSLRKHSSCHANGCFCRASRPR